MSAPSGSSTTVHQLLDEQLGLTIPQASRLLGCARSSVYRMIDAGQLRTYHIGTRRRITTESIRALVHPDSAAGSDVPPSPQGRS